VREASAVLAMGGGGGSDIRQWSGIATSAAPSEAVQMEQSSLARQVTEGGWRMGGFERPGKIVCVGRNYREHADELGHTLTPEPLLFLKPPSAVIGDGDAIVLPKLPAALSRIDFEGELVAIIGHPLRHASPEAALEAVRGYTCGNDVTAREMQAAEEQWTRAKGFDTFCALGPRVTLVDPSDVEITTRLNGEVRQHGRTGEMVVGVGELLAYISRCMTLEAGDAVFTGTPAGVGPLRDGDVVEVEIGGIGVLCNPVRGER
jgi:2-keto-4-pentenoate hydratase/2-oxohepta-3-ene-1,7-dioic acid hydratase in catechol pathway